MRDHSRTCTSQPSQVSLISPDVSLISPDGAHTCGQALQRLQTPHDSGIEQSPRRMLVCLRHLVATRLPVAVSYGLLS